MESMYLLGTSLGQTSGLARSNVDGLTLRHYV